jgi:hypothetical protein
MRKLSTSDYIQVLAVRDWGYIPEIKAYGPFSKRMIRIDQLVNMLNRRCLVELKEEDLNDLLLFITEYNYMVKISKNKDLKEAIIAKEEVEKQLKKLIVKETLLEKKLNPLEDDTSDRELENINYKLLTRDKLSIYKNNITKNNHRHQKQTVKKPRMYEMFSKTIKKEPTIEEKSKFDSIVFDTE